MIRAQAAEEIPAPLLCEDVVIATGGTGVTGRDVTPEAFEALYEKPIPGFGELFRMLSYENIKTSTMQSRATGGVAHGTFLSTMPGALFTTIMHSSSNTTTRHATWWN